MDIAGNTAGSRQLPDQPWKPERGNEMIGRRRQREFSKLQPSLIARTEQPVLL
jgi:hypothetical protein